MNESIPFPEHKIPDIVRIIRRGIRAEKPSVVTRQLERQCKELEKYHASLAEPDEDDEGPPMFVRHR